MEKVKQSKMATLELNRLGYSELLKKLGAKKATAGDLLQFDDSHMNAVPDDPYLRMNAEQLQAKQYVPPPTAPGQDQHVPDYRLISSFRPYVSNARLVHDT